MKAVAYHEPGGPEVLQYADVPDPEPGPVDVVVDVAATALPHGWGGWTTCAADGAPWPRTSDEEVVACPA